MGVLVPPLDWAPVGHRFCKTEGGNSEPLVSRGFGLSKANPSLWQDFQSLLIRRLLTQVSTGYFLFSGQRRV